MRWCCAFGSTAPLSPARTTEARKRPADGALALTGLAGFDQIDSRGMMLTSPPCDAVNTKGEREVKHATNPRTLTLALLPLHHGEDLQGRIEAIGADVLGRDDDAVGLFERVKEYSDVQAVDEPGC